MPIYKIKTPDGRIMKIKGDYPPPQDIVEEAYSKLPPLKAQKPQVQETQIQESVEEPVQEDEKFSFRGFAEQIQQPLQKGETLKTLLNLASFYPTPAGLVGKAAAIGSKVPILSKATKFIAKTAAETVPQATLGGFSTYIGERQKGAYEDEAKKTAEKSALLEIGLGGGIGLTGNLGKVIGKKITQNIPDDLYQSS